jgi:putative ABC transport system permease protein
MISGGKNQSNMILFDIQTSQEQSVDSLTRAMGLPVQEKVPIITVRMVSIDGKTAEDYRRDSTPGVWPRVFSEELRVSYRETLSNSERITEGKWTGRVVDPAQPGNPAPAAGTGRSASAQPVPVSLEDGYARHIGVHVGDLLVYNVQGMDIPAVVGSLRKVQWNRMQTNFRVIFPAGVLESAPQFHVLLSHTPSAEASVKYQQAVVRAFPNVSIIDLGLILSVLDEILDKINYVIHFMAAFSVVTGLIVLIASVRNSKYQRIQESVLLRTLGAGRRQVLAITALEYTFLGALAALTGILIALAGSWLLARYLFKLPFSVDLLPAGLLFAGVSLLTLFVGLLNTRGVLNRPTLEILRTEV